MAESAPERPLPLPDSLVEIMHSRIFDEIGLITEQFHPQNGPLLETVLDARSLVSTYLSNGLNKHYITTPEIISQALGWISDHEAEFNLRYNHGFRGSELNPVHARLILLAGLRPVLEILPHAKIANLFSRIYSTAQTESYLSDMKNEDLLSNNLEYINLIRMRTTPANYFLLYLSSAENITIDRRVRTALEPNFTYQTLFEDDNHTNLPSLNGSDGDIDLLLRHCGEMLTAATAELRSSKTIANQVQYARSQVARTGLEQVEKIWGGQGLTVIDRNDNIKARLYGVNLLDE